MSFENVMKRATLGATIAISLKEILRDPKRGIRNAVDLFDCFTRGIFDEAFMQRIRREAGNSRSSFFKTVSSMVINVDPSILKTVGTNLCYNRLSLFRDRESRKKKAAAEKAQADFCESLEAAVQYGKQLGVYFYVVGGDNLPESREKVLDVCRQNGDCVFYLCADGDDIDDRFAREAASAKNIILAVNIPAMAPPEEPGGSSHAFITLKKHRCLYGFSVRLDSSAALSCCGSDFISRMARSGCLFGWYFCGFGKNRTRVLDAMRSMMRSAESVNAPPLLLLDSELDNRLRERFVTGGRCYLSIGKKKTKVKFYLADKKRPG